MFRPEDHKWFRGLTRQSTLPWRAIQPAAERLEDRQVLSGVATSYAVTSNWGSGFQAQMTLTNPQTTPLTGWTLSFDFGAQISSIWDARIVSHSGSHYVVSGANWDSDLPAGGSLSFGFVAGPGSASSTPTNMIVAGASSTGTGGGAGDGGSGGSSSGGGINASGVQSTYAVSSNWGSGFQASMNLTNTQSSPVTNWTMSFSYNAAISSIWNARVVSHTGNQYVISGLSWDSDLPAGATVSLGFIAGPGTAAGAPTNIVITSGSAGGGGSTVGGSTVGGGGLIQNPVAVNDNASTLPGQATTINVVANDTDANAYPLTVSSVTQPKDGSAVINRDNTLTYTPAAGFVGVDTFSYTIGDGHGGTASASVSVSVVQAAAWPSQVFAPYVDMTLYPTYNLTTAMRTGGLKYFTLAFIVADSNNQPAWGGYDSYEVNGGSFDQSIRSQVAAVRAAGGDVMVSFGGAANQELAQTITNVNDLTAAYAKVVNAYDLTAIDFDIEGAAVADHASIDRRSQAMAALQQEQAAAGKPLSISLTLPVLPSGLTADGLYVVQSALKYGVKIANVNVMAMDYGEGAAPDPQGQMGTYAIEAATSTFNQLKGLMPTGTTDAQLWSMIGVTPMIGVNDDAHEVFDIASANQLEAWAEQHHIGRISMWSLNRDQQDPKGALGYAESTSSSLVQSPYQFSRTFAPFTT